jgi:branched-chain amino acid transport system substrate-binding protein
MPFTSRRASLALAASVLVFAAGCGSDDDDSASEDASSGTTLSLYSSLPLQGAARQQAVAAVNGIKLKLKEVNNKVGDYTIRYQSLDDSTAQRAGWDPGVTSANARKAVGDDNTIAYIGEFNSGATAVSLPILNEAGIPMVSPGNTAVGITSDDPGAEPGEPDKYYPTGVRTYARVLPKDTYQGAAIATLAKEENCASAYIANDGEVYGAGLGRNVEIAAEKVGLEIKGNDQIDTKAANFRSLAGKIEASGADCFIFTGITANKATQVFIDVASVLPDATLIGPEGVAESAFFDPDEGGLRANVAKRVLVTVPGVAPEQYPPAGKQFLKDYEAEYGDKNPDRYAVYGYECASLILDAIERAGENGSDRAAVLEQIFATKDRQGVFGTYGIDQNGDITLTPYGAYKIVDGALKFDRTVNPEL